MASKIIIPDVNIFLSFIVDEEDKSRKRDLFIQDLHAGTIHAIVPSIWTYEICNRLYRLDMDNFKHSNQLFNVFKNFFDIQELDDDIIELAFQITAKFNVPFYDASYHALAILFESAFITLDQKYYEKTKALKHIKLLRDYRSPR